jgi:hypothetical protein
MPRSERPQAVRPQASQGAVAGAAPTPSTSVPQEQKLQISGESGQQMHSGACETFDSGIDPERLRAELIAEAGRSSPMLRNGLELSGAWCLRDSILQIPFADSGFAMSFAKESIPFLSGIASRICGRQIRVEFPVPGKAPAASGSPASAAAGKNQAASASVAAASVAGLSSRPPPQAGHLRASGDAAVQPRSSSSPAGTVQAAGQASVRVQPPVPGVPALNVSPPGEVIAQPESPGTGPVPPAPAVAPLFRDDTAEPESYGADPEGVGQPDAGTGIYVVASTNPAEASPPADFVAAFHDTIRERDAAAATASRTSPDASSAEDPVRLVEMVFRGMRIAAPPQKRQDDTSARGRIS